MFTTLHCLLYPPLKGFSHRSDSHIRVESSLFKAPQGDLKQNAFDIEVCAVLDDKAVFS